MAVGKVVVYAIGLVARIFEVCHCRLIVTQVNEECEW